jgi:hypothetical protein
VTIIRAASSYHCLEVAIEDEVNCIGSADEGETASQNGEARYGSCFHGRYSWLSFDWISQQAKVRHRFVLLFGLRDYANSTIILANERRTANRSNLDVVLLFSRRLRQQVLIDY